jgi:hypothetical protein
MESMSVLLKKKSLDHRVDIEGHHRNVKYQSFAKYSTLNVVASTKYKQFQHPMLCALRISMYEKLKYTKGVIRSCISKTNRQHNGQNKKYKRTNNDPQNIHIKIKIEQHEPH